jgi:hypothetical protein
MRIKAADNPRIIFNFGSFGAFPISGPAGFVEAVLTLPELRTVRSA